MIGATHEIATRIAVVRLGADGIIRQTLTAGAEETLADAQAHIRAAVRLSGGRRCPVLVDIRAIKSQTREARVYYNGPEANQAASAIALLVDSHVSMLIANFFISITAAQSRRPTKLFREEPEAVRWLSGFIG